MEQQEYTQQVENEGGNPDPIKRLWEHVNRKRIYTKSLEEFRTQFSKPESIDKLYQLLQKKGEYKKPKDSFYQSFFPTLSTQSSPPVNANTPTGSAVQQTATPSLPQQQPVTVQQPAVATETPTPAPQPVVQEPTQSEKALSLIDERKKLQKVLIDNAGMQSRVPYNPAKEKERLLQINEELKASGLDPDKFQNDFGDLPVYAKGVDIAALQKEKEENPLSFQRHKAAYKWQSPLFKAIREKQGGEAENTIAWLLERQKTSKTYDEQRRYTREAIAAVKENVDDESTQQQLIKAITQDKAYGYGFIGDNDITSDEKHNALPNTNGYHIAALQFLEDTNPDAYQSYMRLLSTEAKGDAVLGQQFKQRELEGLGMSLRKRALEESMTNFVNKHKAGTLTEEDKSAYQQLFDKYKILEEDIAGIKQRYPGPAHVDADMMAQEAIGQKNGATKKFFLGVGENVDDMMNWFGSILQAPFASDETKILNDLEDFGDKKLARIGQYTTDENRLIQSDFKPVFADGLQKKITTIKEDESLSDEEKINRTRKLILENQNQASYAPNDKAGKFNLTANSFFNAFSDVAKEIVSTLSISYLTGGLGNISKARQLTTLFGSTFATAYNDYYTEAIEKNIANPSTYATIHTAIEAASELIHNDLATAKKLVNPKSTFGKILDKVTSEQWSEIAKASKGKFSKLLQAATETGKAALKTSRKETFEELASQISGNVVDKEVFNQDVDLSKGIKETIVNTFIGTLPLGLFGLGGQIGKINRTQQYALYEMGQNADKYLMQLEEAVKEGTVSPDDAAKIKNKIEIIAEQFKKTKPEGETDNERAENFTKALVSVVMPDENKAKEVVTIKPKETAKVEKTETKKEETKQVAEVVKKEESKPAEPIKPIEAAKIENTPKEKTDNRKAEIEKRRQDELDKVLEDVNDLRNNSDHGAALMKAMGESTLSAAVIEAGAITGTSTMGRMKDLGNLVKEVANGLEIMKAKEVEKINAKYDADLSSLEKQPTAPVQESKPITEPEQAKVVNMKVEKEAKPTETVTKSEELTPSKQQKVNDLVIRGRKWAKLPVNAKERALEQNEIKKQAAELGLKFDVKSGKFYTGNSKKAVQVRNADAAANKADAEQYKKELEKNTEAESAQHSIEITPELKESVKQGMPLFSEAKPTSKLRELADKIRKEGILPEWAKANLPEGTKKSGFDFNNAIADALIFIDDAVKKGMDLKEAIEKGWEKIQQHYKENKAKFKDEADFKERFTKGILSEYEAEAKEPKREKKLASEDQVKELRELATSIPKEEDVIQYKSGDTIRKYHNDEARNEQSVLKQGLHPALVHGEKTLDKAKEIFGDEYVEKTLEFIDTETSLRADEKALLYITLENEMMRRVLQEPKNEGVLKLQDLVREKSQAHLRTGSNAINFGKLRKIGEVGYDITNLTDKFFSSKEIEGKDKIQEAVGAKMDEIQKAYEEALNTEREARETAEALVVKLRAERAMKAVKQRSADYKLSKDQIAKQKTKVKDDIKNAWNKAANDGTLTAVPLPYAKQLTAIAPHVGKLMKLYVQEGILELDQVVKKLGVELKEDLGEEISENDIRGIIAGKFSNTKSKSDISKQVDDLRLEQKLKDRLEALKNGSIPINSKKRAIRNQKIADLQKQIADLKKAESEAKKIQKAAPKKAISAAQTAAKKILIDAGFGKEITVTLKGGKKEKRTVLDWKKLAGEEGSVTKMEKHITDALKKAGMSDVEIASQITSFKKVLVGIRASVIEKSQTLLNSQNKLPVTPEQKAAARRLAELYTYGLFDKNVAQFEVLLGKAIGVSKISESRLRQVEAIAKGMEQIFSRQPDGKRYTDFEVSALIQRISDNDVRKILHEEAQAHGTRSYRFTDLARTYMDLVLRMALHSGKQIIENFTSGFMQSKISSIQNAFEGTANKELTKRTREIAKAVFKDMVLDGGVSYGDTSSTFVNKNKLELYLNNMSDSQLFHAVTSAFTGKLHLDAVDSRYKAKLTEQQFINNVIKVLMQPRVVKGKKEDGMTKQEAVRYVADKLTGQSWTDAKATAKELIDRINKSAGYELVKSTESFIIRTADSIVKRALWEGGKITADMVTDSYNAAYDSAGRNLGHVANNMFSEMVQAQTGKIERRIEDAVKEEQFNKAATLMTESMFFRNIANPFAAGGTNWMFLTLEKAGLGMPISLFYRGKRTKIDLTSEVGMKNLQKALYEDSRYQDTFYRGAVGLSFAIVISLGLAGVTSNDDFRRWRAKNKWAAKYTDLFTPEVWLSMMAAKNKEMGKYFSKLFRQDGNYAGKKVLTGVAGVAEGAITGNGDKADKGGKKFVEGVSSSFGLPLPWRSVRDGEDFVMGVVEGREPYKVDSSPETTYLGAMLKGGMLEYVGLKPETTAAPKGSSSRPPSPPKFKQPKVPKPPSF